MKREQHIMTHDYPPLIISFFLNFPFLELPTNR